ncbi:MAG: twin-arginine translocase TatA/TatE family subunit [Desulfobulbaceae bacterium]|jgi:sec-independent protein translocase protein TatB|nr:twin-arginine translocase TatA/TatE family subunit [Desulfobulbaceae bacterium]
MFGISISEILVILAVALIVVGPDKMPGLARSLARTIFELKKTVESMKEELMVENPMAELKKAAEDVKEGLMVENPIADLNDLKAELPNLAELKPDLPDLRLAAQRFQEQILDVQAEEVPALPEKTAADAVAANEDATVTTNLSQPDDLDAPVNTEVNAGASVQANAVNSQDAAGNRQVNSEDDVRADVQS